jgi:hypothetical protein
LDEERLFSAALELAPELAWPRLELAAQRIAQQRWDDALELVEAAAQRQAGWYALYPRQSVQQAYWDNAVPGSSLFAGLLHSSLGRLSREMLPANLWCSAIAPLRRHCVATERRELLPALLECMRLLLTPPFAAPDDLRGSLLIFHNLAKNWAQQAAADGAGARAATLGALAARIQHAHQDYEVAIQGGLGWLAADAATASAPAVADPLGELRWIHERLCRSDQQQYVAAGTILLPALDALLTNPQFVERWNDPPRTA